MAILKIKAPGPTGVVQDALEVPLTESLERWSELTFEDGTIAKIKMSVLSAIRFPGQFDAEGNPIYMIKGSPTVSIVSSPDELKEKKV